MMELIIDKLHLPITKRASPYTQARMSVGRPVIHVAYCVHSCCPTTKKPPCSADSEGSICILSASCILSAITFDVQIEAETDCDIAADSQRRIPVADEGAIYVENFAYRLMTKRYSDVISAVRALFYESPAEDRGLPD